VVERRRPMLAALPALVAGWLAAAAAQEARPPAEALPQPPKAGAKALPWEAPPPRVGEPILRPPGSAREILERLDIGESQISSFFNGTPLTPSEEDVLVRILFRLPRIGLDNLQRWRQSKVTWDQLAAAPADHRVAVFHVRGRAKHVARQVLLPGQVELFEMPAFYRVTLDIEGAPYRAVLLARRVPAAWKLDEPIDEPASADALFLKVGEAGAENPPLYFAAGRVAWLPDHAAPEHRVNAGQVALARLGMDASQWELVRAAKGGGLGDEDREAFYQLLAAVGRPGAGELKAAEGQMLNVVPLLQHPENHHGEVLPVAGVARRVMKVPVQDADIRSRFGIDHYYEIDMFVPLGNQKLHIGTAQGGKPAATYEHDFPATLIVRKLPRGLSEGENLHQSIRANGVFFKLWGYKSEFAAKFEQVQRAPLFVAAEPAIVQVENAANWVVSALVMTAFGLALAVVGVIAWWQRTSDRSAMLAKKSLAEKAQLPPDFSRLS